MEGQWRCESSPALMDSVVLELGALVDGLPSQRAWLQVGKGGDPWDCTAAAGVCGDLGTCGHSPVPSVLSDVLEFLLRLSPWSWTT